MMEITVVTVREYRLSLAWSVSELARRAGLSNKTVGRIESGEPIYDYTLAAVANALSEALGKKITVDDFEGVNIIGRS
jgi:transcriptional regulator with XRE-family HTH domain